ncbi:MAG: mannose-1-phosphate guanylyltransferase [Planctomycetaceae bacterium]
MLHAVIMSGGSGTRFWPQSRRDCPKQLQVLVGDRTLLQQSVDRLDGLVAAERTWVVTNVVQATATREQLPSIPGEQVIEEPVARNTAACLGLAAEHLLAADPEAVMLVLPADHVIQPDESFREAVQAAVALLEDDRRRLVLFGVPPTRAATGFGYIHRGEPLPGRPNGFQVSSFHEKPDRETAEHYLAAGESYWNSGIFTWRADRIVEALAEHQPTIGDGLATLRAVLGTDQYSDRLQETFAAMPAISIDHAVLEHCQDSCVLEASFCWNDVGSWRALPEVIGSDESGNCLQGAVSTVDVHNCIVRSVDDHLVAVVGVEDLVIVQTADVTLVARRDDEDGLRQLVERLTEEGRDGYL